MGVLVAVIVALAAGGSLPAVLGGLTLAQQIALGATLVSTGARVAPFVIQLDKEIIAKLKAQGFKVNGQAINVQMAINGEAAIRFEERNDCIHHGGC